MRDLSRGIEEVKVGVDKYLFTSNFAFLSELQNSMKVDPVELYTEMSMGGIDTMRIRDVMVASVAQKNGNEITDKVAEMETLITRYGLQECSILASHMLACAMIGDEKKSQLQSRTKMMEALEAFSVSQLIPLENRLWLWGQQIAISGLFAWLTFSAFA